MENYIVKVIVESISGEVISKEKFETQSIAKIKEIGGNNPIDDFISETLNRILDDRRTNPHHHQNRID